MQLAGVACCGHGDKAFLFIVRGQKPLTRTERERERDSKNATKLVERYKLETRWYLKEDMIQVSIDPLTRAIQV